MPKVKPSAVVTPEQILGRELTLMDPDREKVLKIWGQIRFHFPTRGPAKHPWSRARFDYIKRVYVEGIDPERILLGVKGYAAYVARTPKLRGTPFVPMVTTWMNNLMWEEYADSQVAIETGGVDEVLALMGGK